MFDFTPDPVLVQLGPLTIGWYGLGYAVGLAVTYMVMVRLARRAGERAEILANGMIIVAIAALIGGRMYHVIDQWALYKDDLLKIVLPPYSGLGVYGGIATGIVAAYLYARYKRAPFARWTDIVAPGLFTMQAIARWGNFFNQELYGSPTTLPVGHPDRVPVPGGGPVVRRPAVRHDAVPPALPVRVHLGRPWSADADLDRLPPAQAPSAGRPVPALPRLVWRGPVQP